MAALILSTADYGAESNVENVGRMKDYRGNYEEEILSIVKTW